MSEDEEREELDQSVWRSPVEDPVAAPASREPDLLPFHERNWEDFERTILVVADHVDGLRGVRLYGVRGQAQRGIDLYGTDDEGRNVAYQPKRYAEFSAGDLDAAVEKFGQDEGAVGATLLVVCVGCETDRTEISEKLEELRASHPDINIDLYDRRRLSELLKTRPNLVRRLFGEPWATAFCGDADWPTPEIVHSDVLADALVRGPVSALGLGDEQDRAEAMAESDPAGHRDCWLS